MSAPERRKNRYAAHAQFCAPARETLGMRQLFIGFVLIEAFFALSQEALSVLLFAISPELEASKIAGNTPLGLLLNLGSFVFLALGVGVVLRRLHGRSWLSLLGIPSGFLTDFRSTCVHVALLFLAIEALFGGFALGPDAVLRPLPTWVLLLFPALLVLLIQTGAEELLYRGYLQQRIAVLMPHPAAWLIIPNVIFGLAHWSPDASGIDNLSYMIWAFCFGLAASDLTARAGSLAPAIGLHLVNNANAFLFFGEKGMPDSGLSLVLFDPRFPPHAGADTLWATGLPGDLIVLWLAWLAARLAIAR